MIDLSSLQNINWAHYIPFMAALSSQGQIPENRPAVTRLLEQTFVGVVAASIGSYVTIHVQQAEIDNLKLQRQESELRTAQALSEVSKQVAELRQVLLTRDR